jgi:sugar lactone lactonase YvrE
MSFLRYFLVAIFCPAISIVSIHANLAWGANDAPAQKAQMGGAIQGSPLQLSNTVTTFAGSAAANLNLPQGVTTDGIHLYVADTGNHVIRKIVIATGAATTLAGMGEPSADDGIGLTAGFRRPQGLTTDGVNLYVADTYNNTIRKIVLATGVVTTLAGTPRVAGKRDAVGTQATFFNPRGITTDGVNLYITDSRNNLIRKIVIATSEVTTVAGVADRVGTDDGMGILASFNAPIGITTDGKSLYVADTSNNMIRKINAATGEVTTLAGKVGAFGQNDGPGAGASFTGPFGISTDGTYLYVADTFNNAIRRVDLASGLVSTIAGNAAASGFTRPAGIVTNGSQLFILDTNNHAVRVIK